MLGNASGEVVVVNKPLRHETNQTLSELQNKSKEFMS
jgi:hypothetical protein